MAYSNIPVCIQELLDITKDLQAVLKEWSRNRATETVVSDVYVRFGTQFNATVDAFSECNIDTRDLHHIPNDLRQVLEECLGENPSPRVYDAFEPQVRKLIFDMLNGLRAKQPDYWRAVGMSRQSFSGSP